MNKEKSPIAVLWEFIKSWWGAPMPILVYFISDMGLPPDGKAWWMPWAASLVSLFSYVIGRFNAGATQEISEVRMLRAELDAARYSAHKHEVEAVKWKTAYTTRENTQWEMKNQK